MNNAAVKIELEPELEAKYSLPSEVKFCKSCIISNQRPNSSVEYEHTKNSKKETIHFNANGNCDACKVSEKKIPLIGMRAKMN